MDASCFFLESLKYSTKEQIWVCTTLKYIISGKPVIASEPEVRKFQKRAEEKHPNGFFRQLIKFFPLAAPGK
jgi:hypothetical protein